MKKEHHYRVTGSVTTQGGVGWGGVGWGTGQGRGWNEGEVPQRNSGWDASLRSLNHNHLPDFSQ